MELSQEEKAIVLAHRKKLEAMRPKFKNVCYDKRMYKIEVLTGNPTTVKTLKAEGCFNISNSDGRRQLELFTERLMELFDKSIKVYGPTKLDVRNGKS